MKLTPPAPQNLSRRLRFFINHPEYPNASAEIQTCRRLMAGRNKPATSHKRDPDPQPKPVSEVKPVKRGFFAKIFGPRRTP